MVTDQLLYGPSDKSAREAFDLVTGRLPSLGTDGPQATLFLTRYARDVLGDVELAFKVGRAGLLTCGSPEVTFSLYVELAHLYVEKGENAKALNMVERAAEVATTDEQRDLISSTHDLIKS